MYMSFKSCVEESRAVRTKMSFFVHVPPSECLEFSTAVQTLKIMLFTNVVLQSCSREVSSTYWAGMNVTSVLIVSLRGHKPPLAWAALVLVLRFIMLLFCEDGHKSSIASTTNPVVIFVRLSGSSGRKNTIAMAAAVKVFNSNIMAAVGTVRFLFQPRNNARTTNLSERTRTKIMKHGNSKKMWRKRTFMSTRELHRTLWLVDANAAQWNFVRLAQSNIAKTHCCGFAHLNQRKRRAIFLEFEVFEPERSGRVGIEKHWQNNFLVLVWEKLTSRHIRRSTNHDLTWSLRPLGIVKNEQIRKSLKFKVHWTLRRWLFDSKSTKPPNIANLDGRWMERTQKTMIPLIFVVLDEFYIFQRQSREDGERWKDARRERSIFWKTRQSSKFKLKWETKKKSGGKDRITNDEGSEVAILRLFPHTPHFLLIFHHSIFDSIKIGAKFFLKK